MQAVQNVINLLKKVGVFFKKEPLARDVSVAVVVLGIAIGFYYAQAQTYTFIQSSWAGGADTAAKANNDSNRTNWTKFYSKDANISDSTTLTITSSASSTIFTTDTEFDGTNSDTEILGSGSTASVSLLLNTSAAQIATSYDSVCARSNNGYVYCWGNNGSGEIGVNSATAYFNTPKKVVSSSGSGSFTDVASLSVGGHSYTRCASLNTGSSAYCWGYNIGGKLGLGGSDSTNRLYPFQVRNASDTGFIDNITKIASGYFTNCAIRNETGGSVYCWGQGIGFYPVRVTTNGSTPLTGISDIAQANSSSCALKSSDGSVYCWGNNGSWQSGTGSTAATITYPTQVLGQDGSGLLTGVSKISGSTSHFCALAGGYMYCWGGNTYGQLGRANGNFDSSSVPRKVVGVAGSGYLDNLVDITVGVSHTCAIRNGGGDDRVVYCWGDNTDARAGITGGYSTTPVKIAGVSGVGFFEGAVSVSAGNANTCASKSDGTVYCWGGNVTGQIGDGTTSAANNPKQVLGENGSGVLKIYQYSESGTYTSAVEDTGNKLTFTTLSYNKTTPNSSTVTIDVRAGNDMTPDNTADGGDWTAWATNSGVVSGGSISSLGSRRYVQYRVNMYTPDRSVTPTLTDITINYTNFPVNTDVSLISSPFDTTSPASILDRISWSATTPTGTTVKFQVRTAPDNAGSPGTWSAWTGPTAGAGTDSTAYFTNSAGETMPSVVTDITDDQWIQYKVFLSTTDGSVAPTLSSVSMRYVVNERPLFNPDFGPVGNEGVTAAFSTLAGNPTSLGAVSISYSVLDPDGDTGSVQPLKLSPTFEYNIGGTWTAISASHLSSDAMPAEGIAVLTNIYSQFDVIWSASSTLPNTYYASAKIRVKVDDGEAAKNTAYATSSAFIIDTKSPTISLFRADATAGTLTLSAADDSNIAKYEISNSSDFSSATLVTLGSVSSISSASIPWTFSSDAVTTIYVRVTDIYGNIGSTSVISPETPSTMGTRDVSVASTDEYREFVVWAAYPNPAPSGATFQKYQLYRSSDGVNFSALTEITSRTTNYYLDINLDSSIEYTYKVRYVDTNGDISRFSGTVRDTPNGQGETDTTAPTMNNDVTFINVGNSSFTVEWTAGEMASSTVEYGTDLNYGSSTTESSFVMAGDTHSVYVGNLEPNTEYFVRVKSGDISGNVGVHDNNGSGHATTTLSGGPAITNVTESGVTESVAVISWNTDIASNSYVEYSPSSDFGGYTSAGSSDLVACVDGVCAHEVTLSGLTAGTRYYYRIKSTDAATNQTLSTEDGDGNYQFMTTTDGNPPVITNVAVPVRASASAVITWSTDESATSQVEYDTVSHVGDELAYAKTTILADINSIFHSVTLSAETTSAGGGTNVLAKKTKYYYRVKSVDANNNSSTSPEYSFETTEDGAVVTIISAGGGFSTPPTPTVDIDRISPTITNIKVEKITPFGATITFDTDEDARAVVQYGESKTYVNNTGEATFKKKHSTMLKSLRMGTTYHFAINAVDKSGNITTSPDNEFKTEFLAEDLGMLSLIENGFESITDKIESLIESALPSINPPFIEKPQADTVGEDFASVSWRTNIKAYGSVLYATDEDFAKDGKYTGEMARTDEKLIDHRIDLTNLKSNTKYHVMVKSHVFPTAPAQSGDITFVTKAAKVQAKIVDRKKDSLRVVWNTDIPTNSIVEYKKKGSVSANKKTDEPLTTYHDVELVNLLPATTYEIRAYGFTKDENIVESKENITVTTNQDITPPNITSFKVDSALVPGRNDRTQTIVSWKTNEPATSVVYYEEGSGSATKPLVNKQEDKTTFTDNHVVILTNLKPGTIYRLQIGSTDDADNTTKLPIRTIVTPRQNESIVDIIFKNFDDTFKFIKKAQ